MMKNFSRKAVRSTILIGLAQALTEAPYGFPKTTSLALP